MQILNALNYSFINMRIGADSLQTESYLDLIQKFAKYKGNIYKINNLNKSPHNFLFNRNKFYYRYNTESSESKENLIICR